MNEEKYLPMLLDDFCQQDYPLNKIEILLIDSCSKDSTKEIMENFRKKKGFYNIQIIDNLKKNQAAGWNLAIKHFKGEALIRIDAHSRILNDFVSKNVENFLNGETVSGGLRSCISDNDSLFGRLLLETENSLFGASINKSRRSKRKMYVKTMFHAAYKREVFENAGFFNEKLLRSEDNEIHYRIRKKGYKLLFDPQIVSFQYCRNSLRSMLKQKFLNGYWVSLTLGVSPFCLSLYHFVPLGFVISLILCLFLTLTKLFIYPLVSLLAIYFVFCIISSFISFFRNKKNYLFLLMPFLFFLLHISYGFGSLLGLFLIPFKAPKLKSKSEESI